MCLGARRHSFEVLRLKLTIFGLTISSSWGNGHATPYRAILRALHWLGHEVTFYERDVPYYAQCRDFTEAPYCKLVLYSSWDEVRQHALAEAGESDAVVSASYCPEGKRIASELLELPNPLKVFYDLDTPITFSKFAAEETTDYLDPTQICRFDLFLSFVGGRVLSRLEEQYGARMTRPLYGCVDPDEYFPVTSTPRFQCDLSFMGTYAADRQAKLDALFLEPARRNPEMRFLLAGSMYPHFWECPSNLHRTEHVRGDEHPALFSSSKATLNITRQEMADYGYCPSGRFFEASACGCPILTDSWDGLDLFFDRSEVVRVENARDVMSALELPAPDLADLARRARERTLDEHTGMRRAQQLIRYMEEARSLTVGQTAFHPEAA